MEQFIRSGVMTAMLRFLAKMSNDSLGKSELREQEIVYILLWLLSN